MKSGRSATSRWQPGIGGRARGYWFHPPGLNGLAGRILKSTSASPGRPSRTPRSTSSPCRSRESMNSGSTFTTAGRHIGYTKPNTSLLFPTAVCEFGQTDFQIPRTLNSQQVQTPNRRNTREKPNENEPRHPFQPCLGLSPDRLVASLRAVSPACRWESHDSGHDDGTLRGNEGTETEDEGRHEGSRRSTHRAACRNEPRTEGQEGGPDGHRPHGYGAATDHHGRTKGKDGGRDDAAHDAAHADGQGIHGAVPDDEGHDGHEEHEGHGRKPGRHTQGTSTRAELITERHGAPRPKVAVALWRLL